MNGNRLRAAILLACLSLSTALGGEPLVAKRVLRVDPAENLLQADGWRPCQSGFTGDTRTFVCDNGGDSQARRGVMQTVQLDQTRPEPIVASVSSKAEGVSGTWTWSTATGRRSGARRPASLRAATIGRSGK
jgi:hypothetical protein